MIKSLSMGVIHRTMLARALQGRKVNLLMTHKHGNPAPYNTLQQS